ncbi:MAG: glycosyltransferase [Bacteroidales bacterium]|jgi:glycosyltransferase involved in cell wall biosynthesis|nr:glycosyltransferase [Bacteroidales bacterium]
MNSICVAAYNGSLEIEHQLMSILEELEADDEVIIVNDCSTDDTLAKITNMNDHRINVFNFQENKGHVAAFEKAISMATGNYIFLSDQDDIWAKGRYQLMKSTMDKKDVMLLSSNFDCFDNLGNSCFIPAHIQDKSETKSFFKKIMYIFAGKKCGCSVYGCTMVFKKEFTKIILPIPSFVEAHDIWISLAAYILKSYFHLDTITLHRRLSGSNLTQQNRKFYKKVKSRIPMALSVFELLKRKRKYLTSIKK